MPAKIEPLEEEYRESLSSLACLSYLDGHCYEWAVALHRGTGWPLVGLMQGSAIRHAVVGRPGGDYQDVRGRVATAELGTPFNLGSCYELRGVTEDDLRAMRPLSEHSISIAARIAETLSPDLPWKAGAKDRALAFAEELETLSKKYGFYLRSAYCNNKPILEDLDGEEGGYVVAPTANGLAFTIDRYF